MEAPSDAPLDANKIFWALYGLAEKYGSPDDVEVLLAIVSRGLNESPDLLVVQARLKLLQGGFREARGLLDRAVQKQPDNAVALAFLAMCMHLQNDPAWRGAADQAVAQGPNKAAQAVLDLLSQRTGVPLVAAVQPAAASATKLGADGYMHFGLMA